ncbi:F-type H+-transporting ATPase subunit b [Endobacter medicaginis]|uniref:ATP synthase subunit b n=1 Tax=Endobacter medicaginis TaxID=1181271 RepID=A0A839V5I1_9PROT|nr:F0F1 ATP synthase subunit B [Endobacter medicaginis]MBB3174701.1 F-type H+-transporting ATPase subunit b [Endobacter medicaginis]MCX5474904.1 F0F1 ATP synthase subunit B [Endobacter medicaginis]
MTEEPGFFSAHNPLLWYTIAFVLFFGIFGPKLWAAIAAALDGRAASVRSQLDEASRLRREAEALLAEARRAHAQAMDDARATLEGAKNEAAQIAEAARRDAEATARRRERMAHDRIAAAERAAVDDIRHAAATIAADAARGVISETHGAAEDADLVDRAIAGLPAALSGRQAA